MGDVLGTFLGMGDAGAAEGCKVVLLVAFTEGGALSEQPGKALEQEEGRMEKVADSQSSVFQTLALIRGGSDVDIAPLGNAASLES